jgi:cell pole-organizing protein PopZ
VRVLYLSLAVFLAARLASPEEDKRSLAERAEAARGKQKPPQGKVLTNDDLKRAKGNVIFLSATATPPPLAAAPTAAYREVPVSTGSVGEQREQAARLRGSIEEAQKQLAEATPDQRTAIEQRLKNALDELARTHETIGALNERARVGASPVPPSQ